MTHRVVPLMYLLDDRGVVGHGTAGRSSTIQGILDPLRICVTALGKPCGKTSAEGDRFRKPDPHVHLPIRYDLRC